MDPRPLGVLTTSYPAHPGDGAGLFVQGFCRACVRAGWEVEVLCPETADRVARVSEPGITVRRLAYAPRSLQFLSRSPGAPESLSAKPWQWPVALAYGVRQLGAVSASRYRALVSHWLLPSGLVATLGAPGIPQVAVGHGSDVHLLARMPGGRRVARLLVERGVRLVFVSTALRDTFAGLLPARLQERLATQSLVQPMGVDVEAAVGGDRRAVRRTMGLRGPVALFLGRFVDLKQPEMAVALARGMPELTVLLAGAGPLEAALRQRSADLGDRVRYLGWVGEATKRDLLAAVDVLVVPSTVLPDGRSEGMPVVALEALAAGCPVVASAVGGLPDLERLGAGVTLVRSDRPGTWVDAVLGSLSGGRLTETEQQQVAQEVGWETALPRILGSDLTA